MAKEDKGADSLLVSGHGQGRGRPHVEVPSASRLPAGIPADARNELATDRAPGGRFAKGNRISGEGGKQKARHTRLAHRLGLEGVECSDAFKPYKRLAASFRRAQIAYLAATCGGGTVGPDASSFVATAALQLAWSRWLGDKGAADGDPQLLVYASKLGNDSRQNLLAAQTLTALAARARQDSAPSAATAPWLLSEPATDKDGVDQ